MKWLFNWLSGDTPGRKIYYVSWASRLTKTENASFEYIVHPNTGAELSFYAALVSADTKQAAGHAIRSVFSDAALQLVEVADAHRVSSYNEMKRMQGVQTVVETKG